MWIRRAARHVLRIAVLLFLGGLLGASFVRWAPGFGVDERELDARLRSESVQALRQQHSSDSNIFQYYLHYLAGVAHGDLGVSRSLNIPVSQLFAERLPVTFRSVGWGLIGGWLLGLGLALLTTLYRGPAFDATVSLCSGAALSLPSAVLALLFLIAGWPPALALVVVVFPRVYRYTRNLLVQTYERPHVLLAQAMGLSQIRILLWHVLPPSASQILALAGVSVSLAFGAAIPIEVVCDSPGIGQLAWQAALGRDLPLLINITLLVTFVTLVANSFSDLALPTAGNRAVEEA